MMLLSTAAPEVEAEVKAVAAVELWLIMATLVVPEAEVVVAPVMAVLEPGSMAPEVVVLAAEVAVEVVLLKGENMVQGMLVGVGKDVVRVMAVVLVEHMVGAEVEEVVVVVAVRLQVEDMLVRMAEVKEVVKEAGAEQAVRVREGMVAEAAMAVAVEVHPLEVQEEALQALDMVAVEVLAVVPEVPMVEDMVEAKEAVAVEAVLRPVVGMQVDMVLAQAAAKVAAMVLAIPLEFI